MGLEDKNILSKTGSDGSQEVTNQDSQMPEGDDEKIWTQYSLNVFQEDDCKRLNGILNLCREELKKKQYHKRAEWLQRVAAAVSVRLLDLGGNFRDLQEEGDGKKMQYNV